MVHCNDHTFYTGITIDLVRRLAEHNLDGNKGAKYTRSRRPVHLIYQEEVPTRSAACKREYQIKQLTLLQKKALIRNSFEE